MFKVTIVGGSNDSNTLPLHAIPGNTYKPGAIGETLVSTSGRTFTWPPSYGQSLIADWIAEGISGISGYVNEPTLGGCTEGDILFGHYTSGYNMADSFYSASFYDNWMGVFIGDPKMIMTPYPPFRNPILLATSTNARTAVGLQLNWLDQNDYYGISKYQVFIDNALAVDNITGTTTTLTGQLPVGTHTWYIKAIDGKGNSAGTTSSAFINILPTPSTFDLTSPENGTTTYDNGISFSWHLSSDNVGIRKYQLYVDGLLVQDNISGTSVTLNVPIPLGNNTWSVKAIDNNGYVTSASSDFNLNTILGTVPTSSPAYPPVTPPILATSSPTSVSQTSAIFNAYITSDGNASSTVRGFIWGTTSSYGATSTETGTFGIGAFSTTLSSLSCATTYHYAVYAVNLAGTSTTGDLAFETNACPSNSGGSSVGGSSSGGGGGSGYVMPMVATSTVPGCPSGFICTKKIPIAVPNCPIGFICTPNPDTSLPLSNTSTTTPSMFSFTRDLTIGSIGSDVKFLQQYLNSNGFILAATGPGSPGNETTKFGLLTKQALIKFQKANSITPAVGFFGPVTRAKLEALGN